MQLRSTGPGPAPVALRLAPLLALALASLPAVARAGAVEATPTPPAQPILGGDLVGPCGWPNVVSVGGFCSGTLIHPEVVLYAAHCGDEVPWIRFTDAIDDAMRREVVPAECAIHPVGEFGFGTDFAFCRLAEPINDVPITPPLIGCDAEAMLKVGQAATIVGFGESDDPDNPYGIKRWVETTIADFSWDEVFVGNDKEGACYGDSGGPVLVQLADGTWRVFGVTSWGKPGCGAGNYFSLVHNGVDWVETASGVDVTPCTDALGGWDPSPACGGFASGDPGVASGAWDSCTFAPVSGPSTTCGPAFDDAPDTTPPVVTIVDPADGSEKKGEKGGNVDVVITVEAADVGWGTASVALRILDEAGEKELYATEDAGAPFVFPALTFNTGLWTLEAVGVDRAGNASEPHRIVFGVNVAPAAETSGTDTGGETGTTGASAGASTSGGASEGSSGDAGTASETAGATSGVALDDEGCGCRTSGPGGGAWLLGALGLGFVRRRRRALLASALALGGCAGDDAATTAGSEASEASTGGTATSTGEATTSGSTSGSTGSTTAAAPACGDGEVDAEESCDDGNLVDGDGCNSDCKPSGGVLGVIHPEGTDWINDLALDGAGNIIAAGFVNTGDEDAWIGAFAPDGAPLWSATVEGPGEGLVAFFRDVAVGAGGEIVAVGATASGKETSDVLVARYDAAGKEVAVHAIQDDPPARILASSVAVMDDGVAVVVQIDRTNDDVSTLRAIDAAGATVWSLALAETPRGGAVASAPDGSLIAGVREVVDATRSNARIAAIDGDGAILWARSYGEPLTEYFVNEVAVDPASGAIAVVGAIVRASAVDSLALGFDAEGQSSWVSRPALPGPGVDELFGAAFAEQGDVFFAGSGFGKEAFDMWYGRIDGAGETRWARVYTGDGPYADSAVAVVYLASGELVLGGRLAIDGVERPALVWTSP